MLLVGRTRDGCAEEGPQGAILAGCHSGLSAEMAHHAGRLSPRPAAKSSLPASPGLSKSGDDQSTGRGDFDWQERGPLRLQIVGFAFTGAQFLARILRLEEIHGDVFKQAGSIAHRLFDAHRPTAN